MDTRRKPIIIGGVVIIVLLAVFALGTVVMSLLSTPGVHTPELNADNAKPASTDVGGEWQVVTGDAPNISSVGFTFDEILPSDKRTTSGSTQAVRDGDKLTVSTVLRFNRLDYGVKTPEFIAAKVSEEGDLNVLLTFKKS